MALPPAIETVAVTFGPFPDFEGNLLSGSVTFTPVTPIPVVHVPTGTPIVKRPIRAEFNADTGSVGSVTVPATNASDLTVTDFAYQVAVTFTDAFAEKWPTKLVQLPREVPTVDLDVLPAVTTATGVVVNMPVVLDTDPRLTGAVQSDTIDTLVPLTQTAYDALDPAVRDDPRILYVITGA